MQQFFAVKDDLPTKRRAYFEVFVGDTVAACTATLVGVTAATSPIPPAGTTILFAAVPLTATEAALWEAFRVKLLAGVRQYMVLPPVGTRVAGQQTLTIK